MEFFPNNKFGLPFLAIPTAPILMLADKIYFSKENTWLFAVVAAATILFSLYGYFVIARKPIASVKYGVLKFKKNLVIPSGKINLDQVTVINKQDTDYVFTVINGHEKEYVSVDTQYYNDASIKAFDRFVEETKQKIVAAEISTVAA